jgi:hypothetical protein
MRSRQAVVAIVAASFVCMVSTSAPAGAKGTVPNACTVITQADVSTAFAKLDAALQPTSVSEPVVGKPSSQGGFGTNSCSTVFMLPNSVGGSVLVVTNPVTKQAPCPPKGQPGKTVKVAGTKVLVQPTPGKTKTTRNVTFVDQGGCASIEIFLSGGSATVPQSAFVDLAAAALAK